MGGGLRGITLAISKETLSAFLAEKAHGLLLRHLTTEDAGTADAFRLLPFSDTAEEVESYLVHFDLWFVTSTDVSATVLLWIHSEELAKLSKRRDLRDGERRISITSAIPAQGPTEAEASAVKAVVETLQSFGARKLSR